MVMTVKCDMYSFVVVALETMIGKHLRELIASLFLPQSVDVTLSDPLFPLPIDH